jgi:hypothetical protein
MLKEGVNPTPDIVSGLVLVKRHLDYYYYSNLKHRLTKHHLLRGKKRFASCSETDLIV